MYLSMAIKKRIYELCDERNITINKLCTICGITQSTLANINSRQNANHKLLFPNFSLLLCFLFFLNFL